MKNVTVVEHPLIRVRLGILRNEKTPPADFRRALGEIAALMLPDILRDLATVEEMVRTPIEECSVAKLERPLVLVPVLRAGLGMMESMLAMLPEAAVGHIGMARNEATLRPQTYYNKMPDCLREADVVLVDPMLATGWSASAAVEHLLGSGAQRIRFACVVSCPEGIAQMEKVCDGVPIFTAAVDRGLNAQGYIMPGLGDAGDRFFGTIGHAENGLKSDALD